MFGNKKEKQERLEKLQKSLVGREVSTTKLARELGVSRYTIMDDVDALEKKGVKLCEHKGKISLFDTWFKK